MAGAHLREGGGGEKEGGGRKGGRGEKRREGEGKEGGGDRGDDGRSTTTENVKRHCCDFTFQKLACRRVHRIY